MTPLTKIEEILKSLKADYPSAYIEISITGLEESEVPDEILSQLQRCADVEGDMLVTNKCGYISIGRSKAYVSTRRKEVKHIDSII